MQFDSKNLINLLDTCVEFQMFFNNAQHMSPLSLISKHIPFFMCYYELLSKHVLVNDHVRRKEINALKTLQLIIALIKEIMSDR